MPKDRAAPSDRVSWSRQPHRTLPGRPGGPWLAWHHRSSTRIHSKSRYLPSERRMGEAAPRRPPATDGV